MILLDRPFVSLFAYKMLSTQRLLYHSKQKFAKIGIETLGVTLAWISSLLAIQQGPSVLGTPAVADAARSSTVNWGLTVVFAHLRRGANCR